LKSTTGSKSGIARAERRIALRSLHTRKGRENWLAGNANVAANRGARQLGSLKLQKF
jgi:hypothetical protein